MTVSEGLAKKFHSEFGFTAQVIKNSVPYLEQQPSPVRAQFRAVHIGIYEPFRGIEIIAQAVENTRSDVILDLYLIGEVSIELQELVNTSEKVRLCEPLPNEKITRVLNAYDLGLFVLPPYNTSYHFALPNKFFEFLQARLGVIIGPSPEMASYVERLKNGAIAEDFSVDALTAVLDGLTVAQVEQWKMASDVAAKELTADHEIAEIKKLVGLG